MYYQESDTIVAKSRFSEEDIKAIDELLFINQGGLLRIGRISDFTDIEESIVKAILDSYQVAKVVSATSMPICPIDDAPIEGDSDNEIECDLCHKKHILEKLSWEKIFIPRATKFESGDYIPAKSNGNPDVDGIVKIGGCSNQNRKIDIVFIHGLNGDWKTTWHPENNDQAFLPKWLSEDFPSCGVWSLGYDANASGWTGTSMPIFDRAVNVLALLEEAGIGEKPLVFIAHSLGGLVVKKCMQQCMGTVSSDLAYVLKNLKGILFYATPHAGSDLSTYATYLSKVLRTTPSMNDLKANSGQLRELNHWFRNNAGSLKIEALFENKPIWGTLVVDQTSADPGLPGVTPIPLDEDHLTICKPQTRQSRSYSRATVFIKKILQSL